MKRKIESPENPLVKEVINIRERRSKYKHTAFVIEGPNLLEMALNAGAGLRRVFYTEDFFRTKRGQTLLGRLRSLSLEIFEIKDNLMGRLTDVETPQGILAIASYKPKALKELALKDASLLVISDGIQEPGNLGALIRTSDALDADAVILLPGTVDAFMPKTLRASAGSIFNIPVVYADTKDFLGWAHEKGIKIAVTSTKGRLLIYDIDLNIPVAFVFGNESRGVSPELNSAMDLSLKIPIYGKAESLNVSVASAICLYEAVRQRGRHGLLRKGSSAPGMLSP